MGKATCCGGGRNWTKKSKRGWRRKSLPSTLSSSTGLSPDWSLNRCGDMSRPEDRVQPDRGQFGCRKTDGERCVASAARGEWGLTCWPRARSRVILVAGGSGTRLGYEGPKGTFPIGPVSSASLFQIHAEKLSGVSRATTARSPLYIMTSPENHQVGHDPRLLRPPWAAGLASIMFDSSCRGRCRPSIGRRARPVLLASKDRVALSPDGHGGTLAALAAAGPRGTPSCLEEMRERGVRTLYYFLKSITLWSRNCRTVVHRAAPARPTPRSLSRSLNRPFLARRKAGRGRGHRRSSPGD